MEWATQNLLVLNYESTTNYKQNQIIPKIYQTHLQDFNEDRFHPSLTEFLGLFGLKNISIPTTWRWMNYIGFKFDERRKPYFSDRHEVESNVKFGEVYLQSNILHTRNSLTSGFNFKKIQQYK